MSYIGTVANYGGKQSSNTQNVKEFIVGVSGAIPWIYSKLPSGLRVITPSDSKKPVYINNDFYGTNVTLIQVNTNDILRFEVVKKTDGDEAILEYGIKLL